MLLLILTKKALLAELTTRIISDRSPNFRDMIRQINIIRAGLISSVKSLVPGLLAEPT